MVLKQLSFSGGVFIIGLTVVFVGLILLMVYIALQTYVVNRGVKNSKPEEVKQKAIKPSNDYISQLEMNEEALIAVISAAVAAYIGTSAGNLVIRSYRRIGANTPAWRQAGRCDQIYNKF